MIIWENWCKKRLIGSLRKISPVSSTWLLAHRIVGSGLPSIPTFKLLYVSNKFQPFNNTVQTILSSSMNWFQTTSCQYTVSIWGSHWKCHMSWNWAKHLESRCWGQMDVLKEKRCAQRWQKKSRVWLRWFYERNSKEKLCFPGTPWFWDSSLL